MYILTPKIYLLAHKMYILAPKMYILAPKMYILTPKIYLLAHKMYILAPKIDKSLPFEKECFSESVYILKQCSLKQQIIQCVECQIKNIVVQQYET